MANIMHCKWQPFKSLSSAHHTGHLIAMQRNYRSLFDAFKPDFYLKTKQHSKMASTHHLK
jgi:hypothetical protein